MPTKKNSNDPICFLDISKEELEIINYLKNQIKNSCKHFYSQDDRCFYFVCDGYLYGYSYLNLNKSGNLHIFWFEQSEFSFTKDPFTNKEILSKKHGKNYTVLDYNDLLELSARISLNVNLKNLK